MNEKAKMSDVLFSICREDVQCEALKILGRKLDEEELLVTKKHLAFGIGESIGVIYNTIFSELI